MKAFISYSRKDKIVKNKFIKHMKPVADKHGISLWDDSEILPGQKWEERIWREFNSCKLIIMFISVEFLSSEFCMTQEFKRALKRHHQRKAILIPIIVEDCSWQAIDGLSNLQVLPGHNKTVKRGYKNQNQSLAEIVISIDRLIRNTKLDINKKRKNRSNLAAPRIEDYRNSKYKAVFFDLDGTLVRGMPGHDSFRYSWQLVWAHLGFDDSTRKQYYRDYVKQKITYQEWCNISRDHFREKKLKKSDFLKISRKVRLTKNCKQSLAILKQKGFSINLVSGSINTFLEAVFPDCYEYFDNVFINKFQYDHQGVLESINTTEFDFEGKFEAILKISKESGISLTECVFVGEGHNDKYAAGKLSEAGGLSIGYPSDLVFDFVDHDVNKDGLQAVLDVIFDKNAASQKRLPVSE